MKKFLLGFLLFNVSCYSTTPPLGKLHEGDLIFIESTSTQSAALKEGTRSPWTHVGILFKKNGQWVVGEASKTVMLTPLDKFIAKSKGKAYSVKRLKPEVKKLSEPDVKNLFATYKIYEGRPYDIYFSMADNPQHKAQDAIYCSELTYLMYKSLGVEIGKLEKFKDLSMGKESEKLVAKRFTQKKLKFDREQSVVTPVSQYSSDLLFEIAAEAPATADLSVPAANHE